MTSNADAPTCRRALIGACSKNYEPPIPRGLQNKKAGTRPGPRNSTIVFYLQQRKGLRSLALVEKPPLQELPLSSAPDVPGGWKPAKTGQSPPQVKQRLHATAVCAFATSGASAGAGFPPNWAFPPAPPAATCGAMLCAFAGPAFSISTAANASANKPIVLFIRSSCLLKGRSYSLAQLRNART
jgi:hypothetical protein